MKERDPKAMATSFESPYDALPEPLIAIWEPGGREILLNAVQQGYQSLRKVLSNNVIKLISAKRPGTLMNVNTMQDVERVKKILKEEKEHEI